MPAQFSVVVHLRELTSTESQFNLVGFELRPSHTYVCTGNSLMILKTLSVRRLRYRESSTWWLLKLCLFAGIELFNQRKRKFARITLQLDRTKGIHFLTEDWQDETRRTASCIRRTIGRPIDENLALYGEYLNSLRGVHGDSIWQWWSTGIKPLDC